MATSIVCEEQELLQITLLQRQLTEKAYRLLKLTDQTPLPGTLWEELSDFSDETADCFRLEEKLLYVNLDTVAFADHQRRHRFFIDELRTPSVSLSAHGQADIRRLFEFINDWIRFHVNTVDRHARRTIRQQRENAVPQA